ncbi:hypothetical protein DJ021_13820 [Phenylobacterium hankyongense]|uniref:Uncharacterized protein n=1 Tax=Phenylobacterium hankyongense TaxID=1813876 RepID=A0A328B1N7_9CAUL|nr:pilus assembly protein N-terminal domain-containing protein [Phenylobacterium hankyongense]RAK60809.1 hypothetical protein DJ021_13820 [Phenylobacterium hankyongense]
MITLRRPHRRSTLREPVALLIGALAFFASAEARCAPKGYVAEASVREVTADSAGYGGQLSLPVGGSRILRFSQPIGRILLGEPKVGDVIPLGERTLYVLGKAPGSTSLTVLPRGGGAGPMATLDLRVGYDVDATQRALREIMPGEPLEVSARGEGVVLTGLMSSAVAAARAAAVAEQYAPGHVLNLTSIRGAEQVMLSVRVAEVQRTALRQLGLNNINALWQRPDGLTPLTGVLPFALNPDAVANLFGRSTSGKDWTVQALFDALERKGYASTLAEPNLVALSGETAVFFAGGEFPVPVPQLGNVAGASTITIEYKQYGVSIGFTPTVYGDTINLLVAPEVSALDPANSVQLLGFRIPGLTTRRAKTTVELRSGQSFAIAGLIRREFSDSMRGLPGASNLPIFGSLFRSTGYQNNETEVVIVVTAQLAKPTDRRNLLLPTDLSHGPDGPSLYLGGATDTPAVAPRPPPGGAVVEALPVKPVAATTPAPAATALALDKPPEMRPAVIPVVATASRAPAAPARRPGPSKPLVVTRPVMAASSAPAPSMLAARVAKPAPAAKPVIAKASAPAPLAPNRTSAKPPPVAKPVIGATSAPALSVLATRVAKPPPVTKPVIAKTSAPALLVLNATVAKPPPLSKPVIGVASIEGTSDRRVATAPSSSTSVPASSAPVTP